jgi:hypothetical protein
MTNEEMETLIQEMSEQIDKLPDDPEKPLSKEEKKQKLMLQLKSETLKRLKTAREKGNLTQEMKASVDYALLTQYGEKHPLLMNFLKSQMTWFGL